LEEETQVDFDQQPLSDVVEYLKAFHSQGGPERAIEIQLDRAALEAVGVATDTPVTKRLTGVTLKSALRLLLKDLDLTYIIQDEVLLITTIDEAEQLLITKVYPVGDLVIPPGIISSSGGSSLGGGGLSGGLSGGGAGASGGLGGSGGAGGGGFGGGGFFNVPANARPRNP
jgi:hypothetical protein